MHRAFWRLLDERLGRGFANDRKLRSKVIELSRAFTENRAQRSVNYLQEAALRRAYLAYYVPLNFAKVHAVLASHRGVWPAAAPKTLRWIDFGCGPGTAALAALDAFRQRFADTKTLPTIHLDLVDAQPAALELAGSLTQRLAKMLGLDVVVATYATVGAARSQAGEAWDLSLAVNVLNELPSQPDGRVREPLLELWDATQGVMLVMEPGHRVSSQRLVRFRERLLRESGDGAAFLGPCPHARTCPVFGKKHWCHFSEPVRDERLIDLNRRFFRDPRGWLKFSYLLMRHGPMPPFSGDTFRAIGDLHPSGPGRLAIDLCQPDEKLALKLPANLPAEVQARLVRGATVRVDKNGRVTAQPMTRRGRAKPKDQGD